MNIVNDINIKSRRSFGEDENNQCLIEQSFFDSHNMSLGDYIYPVIGGEKIKLKVIGTVRSPEFVYILKDSSQLLPDNEKFGVVYIKQSFGEVIFDLKSSVNNVVITTSETTNIENIKRDIKKELKNYGVKSVLDRDEQISPSMLKQEIDGLESMAGAFPILFFIVASVIIYIMMGRMV